MSLKSWITLRTYSCAQSIRCAISGALLLGVSDGEELFGEPTP
jgi:hypothetical protein